MSIATNIKLHKALKLEYRLEYAAFQFLRTSKTLEPEVLCRFTSCTTCS